VCAYDDEAEFHANYLDGAISLLEFESMVDTLPRDREIIFYCACPDEQTSTTVADEYRAKGFTNVKVLSGGVKGWQRAGFNVPGAPVQ
jgi:rhodanese-related sulfurtransferase